MEQSESIGITRDVVNEYYEAMRYANEYFDEPLKEFIKKYPLQYKHLNAVHRKRVLINSSVNAMRQLNEKIYFGTLTYDETKDHNSIKIKRREAFTFLNSLFEFVLLVEEYGEENGRYHVHFVGNFHENKGFDDFVKGWHSRQNIEVVDEDTKVSQYLCKYLSKQLPRIRRNKRLVAFEKYYHHKKGLDKSFPGLFKRDMNEKIFQLSIFDL